MLILYPSIDVPQTVQNVKTEYKKLSYNIEIIVSSQMPSTPIKSCKKYVLSYKDSSNSTHQLGFYARDAYDCLILAREFNSYVHDHPRSVVRIQQKF